MRQDDLLHRPRGADCFPTADRGFTVRLRARRQVCRRAALIYSCNKYTWTAGRKRIQMERAFTDSEYDYYAAHIREEDTRLAYIFELEGEDGVWFFSEEGVTRTYDHQLAYYSFFQYSFVHDCDVFRPVSWAGSACVYQIFPERFYNGLGEKDYVTCAWDAEPTPKSFYGGDLPGITEKLDYISGLGVNCLYLTPVFPSPSNHKYDIADYLDVDASFGGKPALRELVQSAHARGIRVLLDGVFNHCSSRNALFRDAVEKGPASEHWDWFFVHGDRVDEKACNYDTFAAVPYMPKLNTGNPAVIRYFCDVAAYWIREFGIDGWRLDVCDELSDVFLRALRRAVKAANPDAVIIGEIWHEAGHWLRGDMLDGVMNYAFTKACLDYIVYKTIDAEGYRDRVIRGFWRYQDAASLMGLNLIGSHDTDRFLTRVHGDAELLKMGYAAAFMMPGMVSVYYGDEVGVTGGYEPGCRKGFPWEEERQDRGVYRFIRALYALKKQPALSAGRLNVFTENGMAVLERSAPGQTVRLYMNRTPRRRKAAAGVTVAANACAVMILDDQGTCLLPCE